ncbi:phosphate uptake regulator, PhoU [Desulfacinum hydrothermale DSM 13146]|uniref:Phosphate-specific transport system accessory protein PhoU n=1 Tax=Desulfacinum hydrothermale DSM 13146 TaxID=1121390 RepID=A0A1W1XRU4_9BACT|nr:phosphate signaling complex protein PhoU [Desulfacinum hydrothermale]SMC26584.1 phosphate uptake regulator, PhoU [Desulfacinum hydrothermale DSM 13146]
MKTRFHRQLDELKMTILEMASVTEKAMEKALKAFRTRDAQLAQQVIEGDQEINQLEMAVDHLCLSLLALEQPVAKDLRFIIGSIRMSIDLERIGDQAVNIAQRTKSLSAKPPLPPVPELDGLADTAMDMLRVAISSFANRNISQAYDVCQMDDEADELNVAVLKKMIDLMVTESRSIERAVQTIIVARCLERVADQTTNIAESVIFMAEGVNIKHRCEP